MKRQCILIGILFAVLLGMTVSMVALSGGLTDSKRENETYLVNTILVPTQVIRETVTHTRQLTGRVGGDPSRYRQTLAIKYESDFLLNLQKGESFHTGEVLYICNGEEKKSDFSGMLIEITESTDEDGLHMVSLSFLNYDELIIQSSFDADDEGLIGYACQVSVTAKGQTYSAIVKNIGYEIQNGKIDIGFSLPVPLLPGTPVTLKVMVSEPVECLLVDEDFVFWDGQSYYVKRQSGLGYSEQCVTVGEKYTKQGTDGKTTVYYEILDGVLEGDTVVVETVVH